MVVSPRADAPASESTAETSESLPRKYLACVFKRDSNSFNETTLPEQEAHYQSKGEKSLQEIKILMCLKVFSLGGFVLSAAGREGWEGNFSAPLKT